MKWRKRMAQSCEACEKAIKENNALKTQIRLALLIIDTEEGMKPVDEYKTAFNALRAMLTLDKTHE
jgi:hypothetical protein